MSETMKGSMKELQNYLKDLIGLETDVATQNQIIQQYHESSLSREPVLQLLNEPRQPEPPHYNQFRLSLSPFCTICVILGAVMVPLMLLGAAINNTGDNAGFLQMGLWSLLFFVPYIFMKVNATKENQSLKESYEASLADYENACKDVAEKNRIITQRYQTQHEAWENNSHQNVSVLGKKLYDTQSVLSRLYGKNLIYEKYHNLPALTSIYEYLLIGRCDSLTGPHGAYNLYEDEVRKDTVISQLNVVIENLEKIKANQYMLYQQVKAIQEQTQVISYELRRIDANTTTIMELSAVNAYYSALTARNTEITMAYHLMNG